MKIRTLELLQCPNRKCRASLEIYAVEGVRANGDRLSNTSHVELEPDDDVRTGLIADTDAGYAYPIYEYVASLLDDGDADFNIWMQQFSEMNGRIPDAFSDAIQATLDRLKGREVDDTGSWNQDEMRYYDHEVSDQERRAAMVRDIQRGRSWHILLQRQKLLVDPVKSKANDRILEVGCGNARTIHNLWRPKDFGIHYVGTDISLLRLVVARNAIPEGEFIQCSALNLPFHSEVAFSTVISFGALHHFPDQVKGLEESAARVASRGALLLHEPLRRPTLLKEGSFRSFRNRVTDYEHSEHDGDIDYERMRKEFSRLGLSEESVHLRGSILRTVGKLLLSRSGLYHSRTSWKVLLALDHVFVRLFCHRPNRFGPKMIFLILRKR